MDTRNKLSPVTVALHWIVGVTVICLLAAGIYMDEAEAYALYPIHKSIGMLIFVVILARVFWRIKSGWPEPVSDYARWEQHLSKVVHYGLLLGTLVMPISGMMMSGGGGHGLKIFGFELLAANPSPDKEGEMVPLNETVAGIGHELHEIVGPLLIFLILLHMVGAFKHHFMDKDGTLRRMLGKEVQ